MHDMIVDYVFVATAASPDLASHESFHLFSELCSRCVIMPGYLTKLACHAAIASFHLVFSESVSSDAVLAYCPVLLATQSTDQ